MKTKRLAILCPYPFGEAPSQRFRFEQYVDSLQVLGWEVYTYSFLNEKGWKVFYTDGFSFQKLKYLALGFVKRWFLMLHVWRFNTVLIHREAAPVGPPIYEWIIAKGFRKKIIYDFDDAIWLPNYSKQHQKVHRLKAYWKIKHLIRWAHLSLAGNHFLASYALKFSENVVVFPTTIDTDYHRPQNKKLGNRPLVLGWTGSHSTLDYLRILVPALEKLSEHYLFEFVVISNEPPPFTLPNLRYLPWNEASEIEDLGSIDLGLMPLTDDEWSKGKCGFKALQYLALGIPAMVSTVGVNADIITHGVNGFLVDHPDQWYSSIEYVLKHPEPLTDLGRNGRKTIEQRFSVAALTPTYLSFFNL
ncbi:MAG: glycosyltransferase [Flavobacteriales bacterium]